jgi:hypothetical protein
MSSGKPQSQFDNFDDDIDEDDLDELDEDEETFKEELVFDLEALVHAWQDDAPDNNYYLDTRNGSVKLVHQNLYDLKQLTDEIEKHKERYLYLPKPAPNQLKDDLRDFQNTIENKNLQPILDMALVSPHPLAGFNKVLSSHPEELARLKEFRESRVRLRIKQWFEANSLTNRWDEQI